MTSEATVIENGAEVGGQVDPLVSQHFNRLTPAEAERLALLAEECGELIQIIGKILRHGYESTHPDGGPTNRTLLMREAGDVLAALDLMYEPDLNFKQVYAYRAHKMEQVAKYLHHQAG